VVLTGNNRLSATRAALWERTSPRALGRLLTGCDEPLSILPLAESEFHYTEYLPRLDPHNILNPGAVI
jgi:hypothetical protein